MNSIPEKIEITHVLTTEEYRASKSPGAVAAGAAGALVGTALGVGVIFTVLYAAGKLSDSVDAAVSESKKWRSFGTEVEAKGWV